MPCEYVFDVVLARNRLLLSGGGIEVDVVARAMAVQDTSGTLSLSDEVATPHRAISFMLWSSGTSSITIIW